MKYKTKGGDYVVSAIQWNGTNADEVDRFLGDDYSAFPDITEVNTLILENEDDYGLAFWMDYIIFDKDFPSVWPKDQFERAFEMYGESE